MQTCFVSVGTLEDFSTAMGSWLLFHDLTDPKAPGAWYALAATGSSRSQRGAAINPTMGIELYLRGC